MSITRKKVRTDDEITKALVTAVTVLGIVTPDEVTLTTITQGRLLAINTSWGNAIIARDKSTAERSAAVAAAEVKKVTLSMFSRHFIMVFNLGVTRGVYDNTDRAYYHLDINSDATPDMRSEADILLWAKRIVDGDALRVTAGGAAMSNPTALQVSNALTNYKTANNAETLKEAAYKATLTVLNGLRPEAEAVILKVWDETETFYNEESAAAKRDKCREWGVLYISDQTITINLLIVNAISGLPVNETSTYFKEGDTTHPGNELGICQIKTTVSDKATLTTNAPDYLEIITVIIFETDVYEYNRTVKMTKVE